MISLCAATSNVYNKKYLHDEFKDQLLWNMESIPPTEHRVSHVITHTTAEEAIIFVNISPFEGIMMIEYLRLDILIARNNAKERRIPCRERKLKLQNEWKGQTRVRMFQQS